MEGNGGAHFVPPFELSFNVIFVKVIALLGGWKGGWTAPVLGRWLGHSYIILLLRTLELAHRHQRMSIIPARTKHCAWALSNSEVF